MTSDKTVGLVVRTCDIIGEHAQMGEHREFHKKLHSDMKDHPLKVQ